MFARLNKPRVTVVILGIALADLAMLLFGGPLVRARVLPRHPVEVLVIDAVIIAIGIVAQQRFPYGRKYDAVKLLAYGFALAAGASAALLTANFLLVRLLAS